MFLHISVYAHLSKKHVLLFKLLILIEILTCYNELNNIVPCHKEKKNQTSIYVSP